MMSPPGKILKSRNVYYLSDIKKLRTLWEWSLYYTLLILLLKNCKLWTIVCQLFCLTLCLFLPVVSSCWLNRPVGTKEMSRLTGLLALQSVLSSERCSFTYPKSACFQKSSWAASREWALTGQRFKKQQQKKTHNGSSMMHGMNEYTFSEEENVLFIYSGSLNSIMWSITFFWEGQSENIKCVRMWFKEQYHPESALVQTG